MAGARLGSDSTAISIGFGVVSRLVASRIWKTSAIGRPTASCSDQPVNFSATEVEEGDVSCDVGANNGVADGVERDLGAFLFHEQRLFHALALDGIAQGSQKSARLDLDAR